MASNRNPKSLVKGKTNNVSERRQKAPHMRETEFEPNKYRMDDETRQRLHRARAVHAGACLAFTLLGIYNFTQGPWYLGVLVLVVAGLFGGLSFIINRRLMA